jgi:hypothetical protein
MQMETRIQDDPELASRYLAGQLSPGELQAYEQHLLENPEAVRELEATARMKVGMANLRDTGQLDRLLQARNTRNWQWPALAAAAALIVIAVGLWRGGGAPRATALVAAATELTDQSGRPLIAGSSYALLRTRSSAYGAASAYDAAIALPPEPRAIELRVLPEVAAPAYGVALSRIQPDGSVTQIGSITELTTGTDGFVRLYVDSSRLEAGPYLLVITPTADRAAASATAFRIKVGAR